MNHFPPRLDAVEKRMQSILADAVLETRRRVVQYAMQNPHVSAPISEIWAINMAEHQDMTPGHADPGELIRCTIIDELLLCFR